MMVIKMLYDFVQFPISMEFAQSHKVHILHTLLYGSNMKTYTMHFNFLNISVYILEILIWHINISENICHIKDLV